MESLFPQACGLSVSHKLFHRGGKPPRNGFGKVFFFHSLLALIGGRMVGDEGLEPPTRCV